MQYRKRQKEAQASVSFLFLKWKVFVMFDNDKFIIYDIIKLFKKGKRGGL